MRFEIEMVNFNHAVLIYCDFKQCTILNGATVKSSNVILQRISKFQLKHFLSFLLSNNKSVLASELTDAILYGKTASVFYS